MRRTKRTLLALLTATFLATAGGTGCEPELLPDPGTYPMTSHLGINEDGSMLYVALTDHDKVRAINATTGDVVGEVTVVGGPHRLTVLTDGRVAVTSKEGGELTVINTERMEVESSVFVGSQPYGVIEADGHLVIAVSGENDIARIALDDLTRVKDRVALDESDPRGLSRGAEGQIYVSHFTAGTIGVVDVQSGVVSGNISMALPSRSFFFPNQVDSITVTPDDGELVVPLVQCNNDPAQFAAGSTDFVGATPEYYVEGPTGFPAVVPGMGRIDTTLNESVSDLPGTSSSVDETNFIGAVPAVINPHDSALLGGTHVNGPVAAAMGDGGRLEMMVNRGSGNVMIRRNQLQSGQPSIVATVDVGIGADSIVLSPDGKTAYVYNAFDYTVTSFDVPRMARVSTSEATTVTGSPSESWGEGGSIATLNPNAVFTTAEQVLPDDVVEGRVLFHAIDDRMTRAGAIACASCHPGGGDDGITWAFEDGPRQTPPLWGGILGTEPFHWNEEVRDMAAISTFTIETRMGGGGLPPAEMNKIGAFLDTIPAPAPPANADFASIERGAEIFYSDAAECSRCHSGPDFTDNRRHDVATGRTFTERESDSMFATPPLKGLAHSGPYLHSGEAETLRDLVEMTVVTDRMGHGSHLSPSAIDDLVHFLEQL